MKKCRFEVSISYDEQFFAEGEIQETIRTSIEKLGENKVNRYGRDTFMKNGWVKGIHPKVVKVNDNSDISAEQIGELVFLNQEFLELSRGNEVMEEEVPKLPEHKMNQLLAHVKKAFSKKS